MSRDIAYNSRLNLCGDWYFAWQEDPMDSLKTRAEAEASLDFYPCQVPGNFELDLNKIGKLPDPFFAMNPVLVREKTEKCHVFYGRTFEISPNQEGEPHLVFEGLDCFADVYINGNKIASFDNMLIEHEINIEDYIRLGENEIFIHIRPAIFEALKYDYPQLMDSLAVNYESIYIRKAAHMYGWDIMPRFLSAGIYRPVFIEYRPSNRFLDLYLWNQDISEDRTSANLNLNYRFKSDLKDDYSIRITMKSGDFSLVHEAEALFNAGKISLTIDNPKLWWPKGRGEANLYDVEVELIKDGKPVDIWKFRHGIRTVELERTALTTSTGDGEFVFIVNGEKIFAKGTNWVPADAFHSRDRERIPKILDMANDLNCNMIRCWGGNVYEDEIFYDICDESGILIWQDFSMACSIYPQDDDFAEKIRKEGEKVVKRLRKHPSVALWSGDNECDYSYLWGGTSTDPNTNILTRKILPEVIRLHDSSRPYIASSPFFDEGTLELGADYLPEMHLWGPRNYFKSEFYVSSLCHFVSEIGYHGCPSPESISKFISEDKIWPMTDNEEWILHSTSPVPRAKAYDYRVELMRKQVAELFTYIPDNLEEFSFASQVVQAEAKKFFIEMFRVAKWRRTGILWWNLMDGWPQFSDAIVDYYFKKKLAYSFIKNVQQDVCLMLDEPREWSQNLVGVNDTPRDINISCSIIDIDSDETVFEGDFILKRDSSTVLGEIPFIRNKQRFFLIKWDGEAKGYNHYLSGHPPFDIGRYLGWLRKSGLYDDRLEDFKGI